MRSELGADVSLDFGLDGRFAEVSEVDLIPNGRVSKTKLLEPKFRIKERVNPYVMEILKASCAWPYFWFRGHPMCL